MEGIGLGMAFRPIDHGNLVNGGGGNRNPIRGERCLRQTGEKRSNSRKGGEGGVEESRNHC